MTTKEQILPEGGAVLGMDTSTSACSAAIWRGGQVLARRFQVMARGQAEALAPMVRDALADARLSFAEIALIGVTIGPGAFTGLRIGLATARAMGLAAKIPVAGVTTTEAVAAAVGAEERQGRVLLAVIESKREDLFVQPFGPDGAALAEIASLPPEAILQRFSGPMLLAGDALDRLGELPDDWRIAPAARQPDAAIVARLAAEQMRQGRLRPANPLYLRAPDVSLPQRAAISR